MIPLCMMKWETNIKVQLKEIKILQILNGMMLFELMILKNMTSEKIETNFLNYIPSIEHRIMTLLLIILSSYLILTSELMLTLRISAQIILKMAIYKVRFTIEFGNFVIKYWHLYGIKIFA